MLLNKKASNLVALSDSTKLAMTNCINTAEKLLEKAKPHKLTINKLIELGKKVNNENYSIDEIERSYALLHNEEYSKAQEELAYLQYKLSSETMSFIIICCFTIESYINTLSEFLLKNYVNSNLLDFFKDNFDKAPTIKKWSYIGKLNGKKFDESKEPYQNLKLLFEFRNKVAHDKVENMSKKVKNHKLKLPDFQSGSLRLEHAIFSANTYDSLITELKNLIGKDIDKFQQHYNLSCWLNPETKKQANKASDNLKTIFEIQ